MSMFERIVAKRRRADETPTRATCLRCRREYTRDPLIERIEEYCWWCAERIEESAHRA